MAATICPTGLNRLKASHLLLVQREMERYLPLIISIYGMEVGVLAISRDSMLFYRFRGKTEEKAGAAVGAITYAITEAIAKSRI